MTSPESRLSGSAWLVLWDSGAGDGGVSIIAVCSTPERAETIRKRRGGEVEEFPIDREADIA